MNVFLNVARFCRSHPSLSLSLSLRLSLSLSLNLSNPFTVSAYPAQPNAWRDIHQPFCPQASTRFCVLKRGMIYVRVPYVVTNWCIESTRVESTNPRLRAPLRSVGRAFSGLERHFGHEMSFYS